MEKIIERFTSREFIILVASTILLVTNAITLAEFASINGITGVLIGANKIVKAKTTTEHVDE